MWSKRTPTTRLTTDSARVEYAYSMLQDCELLASVVNFLHTNRITCAHPASDNHTKAHGRAGGILERLSRHSSAKLPDVSRCPIPNLPFTSRSPTTTQLLWIAQIGSHTIRAPTTPALSPSVDCPSDRATTAATSTSWPFLPDSRHGSQLPKLCAVIFGVTHVHNHTPEQCRPPFLRAKSARSGWSRQCVQASCWCV